MAGYRLNIYISRLGFITNVLVTSLKGNIYFLSILFLHLLSVSLSFVYMQRWYIEYYAQVVTPDSLVDLGSGLGRGM